MILFAAIPGQGLATAVLGSFAGDTITETCDVCLVKDRETGVYLAEKGADIQYPYYGGAVRWMTALVALDYLSLSESVVAVRRYDETVSSDAQLLGIHRGRQYTIRDLTAAMLIYGAEDATIMLRNLTVQAMNRQAGYGDATNEDENTATQPSYTAESFIALMNEKAASLGMTQTQYKNITGVYEDGQLTNAADQMILLESLLENKLLSKLVEVETYTMESEDAGVGSLRTMYSLMNRQSANYDARVKAMTKGSGPAGVQSSLMAQSGSRQTYMVLWQAGVDDAAGDALILQALDQYAAMSSLDLYAQLDKLAKRISVAYEDKKVNNWELTAEAFTCFAYAGFSPDADKLVLTPEEATIRINADETLEMQGSVVYDGNEIGKVQLATRQSLRALPAQQSATAGTTLFESQPVPEAEGPLEEYMWLIIIAGAAVLGLLVFLAGKFIRDRIEY